MVTAHSSIIVFFICSIELEMEFTEEKGNG
jgi:hypothetical protein